MLKVPADTDANILVVHDRNRQEYMPSPLSTDWYPTNTKRKSGDILVSWLPR